MLKPSDPPTGQTELQRQAKHRRDNEYTARRDRRERVADVIVGELELDILVRTLMLADADAGDLKKVGEAIRRLIRASG
jgi:hypothetical protein